MNTLLYALTCLFTFCLPLGDKIKDVEIVAFDEPYDKITVEVDGKNYDYYVTPKTKFTSEKSGQVPMSYYKPGSYIDLDFEIEGRQRLAKKVKLKSDYTPGKEKFTGVLEFAKNEEAFIDGRKVVLDMKTEIECSGKKICGCTKGMQYLGFDELNNGDFLKVSGFSDKTGTIVAKKIEVCENTFSESDQILRLNLNNSFSDDGTRIVSAPAGITGVESLHQGKIKMGLLEYQLHNDIKIQGYVNLVGNKVIPDYAKKQEYKDKHQVSFRFYVINDAVPNAFAFPNGMVFIHTGLLQIMENEAQLAAVLGHEIAHVTYEHSAKRAESNAYLDSELVKSGSRKFFEKLGLGNSSNGTVEGDIIESLGDAIMATKPSDISNLFHKDNETQADRVGMLYMFNAGYDIREAPNFWKIMKTKTNDSSYITNLQKSVKDMFFSSSFDLSKRGFKNLASETSNKVVTNFLNTIYTSHPLAKKRLRDLNDLVNTVYSNEDLDKLDTKVSRFEKYINPIK